MGRFIGSGVRARKGLGWLLAFVLAVLSLGVPLRGASPVARAARAGDLTEVLKLIEARTDVNVPEGDGSTALLWAAYQSDLEMVRALIAAGARPDAANRYGVTPLLQASRTGDTAVIEALLEAGADPEQAHPEGETPLMAASRTGSVDAVRLLLARGADVNAADSFQEQTALMWAAAEGHAGVVHTLLEADADPDRRARVTSLTERKNADHPTGGFTALMWAARNGHGDVVRRLAEAGADLNITNGDGATAMMIAIVNDRFDLAAMLLEAGADANDGSLYHAVEMRDATTDMFARDGSQLRANHSNERTALDLIKLLLERGADPNKSFVGQFHSTSMCCGEFANASPFYRAAVAADVEALKLMIERGADLELTPSAVEEGRGGRGANANVGRTPIMVAMTGGRGAALGAGPGFSRQGPPPFREPSNRNPIDAIKLLLEAGASPDATTPDGLTLLHQAAQSGNLDVIRALAQAGATLDLPNGDGLTALDVAEGRRPEGGDSEPTPGAGPARGRGASAQEVAALLRELMGLPPAPATPAAPETEPPPASEGEGL